MIVGEVAEELSDDVPLLGGEEGTVVEFVNVAHVGKDTLGRRHVLVDIVEVAQQQLSPAVEVVEGLVDACTFHKTTVQVADEFDGVGHGEVGMTAEEVADRDIGRTPQGLCCETGQMLVEEERGTLVGENHSHPGEIGAETVKQVGGDIF